MRQRSSGDRSECGECTRSKGTAHSLLCRCLCAGRTFDRAGAPPSLCALPFEVGPSGRGHEAALPVRASAPASPRRAALCRPRARPPPDRPTDQSTAGRARPPAPPHANTPTCTHARAPLAARPAAAGPPPAHPPVATGGSGEHDGWASGRRGGRCGPPPAVAERCAAGSRWAAGWRRAGGGRTTSGPRAAAVGLAVDEELHVLAACIVYV